MHRESRVLICLLALALLALSCSEGTSTDKTTDPSKTNPDGKADWFSWDVPYADMSNATSSVALLPIRGRLVEESPDAIGSLETTPFSQLTQDELDDEVVELKTVIDGVLTPIASLTTDSQGWLDTVLDIRSLGLPAGRHDIEIWYDGESVGVSQVLLLEAERVEPIVRSDVDMTYLYTDFQSLSAMAKLLGQDASERVALDGMGAVYRALRADSVHPVTFLSGSPRSFKRTLENKIYLDGMEQDGLVLKPYKDIIVTNLLDFDVTSIMPELKEQVGYKLFWLLKMRQELPATTPEILMGDDTEADVVAYSFYTYFLSGKWDVAALDSGLRGLDVASSWREQILVQAQVLAAQHATPPVAIYINKTTVPGADYAVADWAIEGLTRYHQGAWPLILDLYEGQWVSGDDVEAVRAELEAAGVSADTLREQAAAAEFLEGETVTLFW